VIRSVLSNWVALALGAVITFALTPILVHKLGHFHFGLWILVGSLVDYFGLLDIGIRTTLQRFVAHLKGRGERDALNETFATGIALTAILCVLIVVATAALVLIPPDLFGLGDATRPTFQGLVVLLGASVAVTAMARFLGAYICGLQRFDLYNLTAIVCAVVRAVVIVVALETGRGEGTIWVGVATLVSALLMAALHWHFVRRLDRDLRFSLARVKIQRARELVSFSVYVFLITAGEYVRTYSASVIIARVLGVAAITPFNIAARLMEYMWLIVLGVIGPLMPRMSELHGQGRRSALKDLVLRAVGLTTLLASLMAWLLVLNGDALIRLWLGPGFDVSAELMLILLVGAVLAQSQASSGPLLIACGRHRVYAWWTLGEAAATIALGMYWVHDYGLAGVAMAMTVPRVLVKTIIQPWYVLHVLELRALEYVRAALLRPLVVNTIFLVVCLRAGAFDPTTGLRDLLWAMAWETALLLALSYGVGLTPAVRQAVRQRARRSIERTFALAGIRAMAVEPSPVLPMASPPAGADKTGRR
jgi:O-antigen/teichoic acid export membrane protein